MTPQQPDPLERLITKAVRDLPPRRAPGTLEQRVQAEIARRAALPWWRKSFVYWPMAARAVFVLVSGAAVKLVLDALVWLTSGVPAARLETTFATERHWFELAQGLAKTVVDFAAAVAGSIPPLWLYGTVAVIAGLYATVFGIGAAAYRSLSVNR